MSEEGAAGRTVPLHIRLKVDEILAAKVRPDFIAVCTGLVHHTLV